MFWWEYLEILKEQAPSGESPELVSLLEASAKSVMDDVVWESSGIEKLLQRAVTKAQVAADEAREDALQLLSFHLQRNVLVSSISGASSGSGELGQELGEFLNW
jgi:hypothetical protein